MDIYGEVCGCSQQQNLTTWGNINRVLIADCQQSPFKEIQVSTNIFRLIKMSSDHNEMRSDTWEGMLFSRLFVDMSDRDPCVWDPPESFTT